MEILKQIVALGLVTTLGLSMGCANRVSRPVSDELRDTQMLYEGRWEVHRLKSPRYQFFGPDRFNCPTDEFKLRLAVRDGVMEMNYGRNTYKTNVASNGSFRLEIPTDGSYKRPSGANDNKSEITVILQGSLAGDKPAGFYTIGTARINNRGCEAPTKFKKL